MEFRAARAVVQVLVLWGILLEREVLGILHPSVPRKETTGVTQRRVLLTQQPLVVAAGQELLALTALRLLGEMAETALLLQLQARP